MKDNMTQKTRISFTCPLGEVVEVLPVPGISTYKSHVPLQAVVDLEALATSLPHRDMATMLTTHVLVKHE